jgi:prepilin-type N-terminal cleavage/methylation domain-containing protein
MDHRASRGFSLVELLVVITIIVVLLALLTPALDQAIYQAELAACGAQLKGIGTGVLTYAAASRQSYRIARPVCPAMSDDVQTTADWPQTHRLRILRLPPTLPGRLS